MSARLPPCRGTHPRPEGQPRPESGGRCVHENEDLGIWGDLSQQWGHPRIRKVVRRPFVGQSLRHPGEPLVAARDLRRAEWPGIGPRQVVLLLREVPSVVPTRLLRQELEPPAGARLLGAPTEEVRGSCHLAGEEVVRSEVLPVLPRRVVPPGLEEESPDVRRQALEDLGRPRKSTHQARLPCRRARRQRPAGGGQVPVHDRRLPSTPAVPTERIATEDRFECPNC